MISQINFKALKLIDVLQNINNNRLKKTRRLKCIFQAIDKSFQSTQNTAQSAKVQKHLETTKKIYQAMRQPYSL